MMMVILCFCRTQSCTGRKHLEKLEVEIELIGGHENETSDIFFISLKDIIFFKREKSKAAEQEVDNDTSQ